MILLVFFCVCSFLKFTDSELPLEYCTELINYDTLYRECLHNPKTIPLSYKTRCKEYKKDGRECKKLFKHISKVTTRKKKHRFTARVTCPTCPTTTKYYYYYYNHYYNYHYKHYKIY
ncbi:uncharacterized protein LOC124462121 [Drosophila willistoni]|uniref:uncharacterized protein LOC124462121 n=1 Tax=Drosophila willistoni TaxID=7260 RepID=UPI001F082FC2|nr:uncharacterized protein LOC124462121 [Drosophila willistoni]